MCYRCPIQYSFDFLHGLSSSLETIVMVVEGEDAKLKCDSAQTIDQTNQLCVVSSNIYVEWLNNKTPIVSCSNTGGTAGNPYSLNITNGDLMISNVSLSLNYTTFTCHVSSLRGTFSNNKALVVVQSK